MSESEKGLFDHIKDARDMVERYESYRDAHGEELAGEVFGNQLKLHLATLADAFERGGRWYS